MSSKRVDEYKFLIDVNLPRKFAYFNRPDCIHVADINPCMTDSMIWNYAIQHNCIILTKDTDFYDLFLTSKEHPKVIYFKLGNYTLAGLHDYFRKNWHFILEILSDTSFIIAEKERITIIK